MDDPKKFLDIRYEALTGYFHVVGLITSPALVLKNPVPGEARTVVIGTPVHKDMVEITKAEALEKLEHAIHASGSPLAGPGMDPGHT